MILKFLLGLIGISIDISLFSGTILVDGKEYSFWEFVKLIYDLMNEK